MNKFKKGLTVFLLTFGLVGVGSFAATHYAKAEGGILDLWSDPYSENQIGKTSLEEIGLGNKDPREIAAGVVRVMLGFLGIIAVILILVGGFQWMTAQGNDAKISKAQGLMKAGVIGLLIVLASFGISMFVMRSLLGVTGAEYEQADYSSD